MKKKYESYDVFDFSENLIKQNELIEIKVDSINWRIYYTNKKDNWIRFNPFSEYHGGGQPYIINIGQDDFENWVLNHPNFVKKIRELILNE